MAKAGKTPSHAESTNQPKHHPDKLEKCWEPDTPRGGYRPYKVQVTNRAKVNGVEKLTFMLVPKDGKTPAPGPFTVEIPGETVYVWSERPSTAQLVEQGGPAYGFLYLSDQWAKEFKVDRNVYAESGGGKFPIAAGTKRLQQLFEALEDEVTQRKLLDAVDALLGQEPLTHKPTRDELRERMNSERVREKLVDALAALVEAVPLEDKVHG